MKKISGQFKGVFSAFLTPYRTGPKSFEELDRGAISRQVEYLIEECGVNGVVVAGARVQEFDKMALDEIHQAIDSTVDRVNGRLPVVAGVSRPSTSAAIRLAKYAEDAGADAVLSVPPTSPGTTIREAVNYFKQLSNAINLPLVVFNNPDYGIDMPVNTLSELADQEQVACIKESSRHAVKVARESMILSKKVAFMTVHHAFLHALSFGAQGAMMPIVVSKLGVRLYDAFRKEDYKNATAIQRLIYFFPPEGIGKSDIAISKAALTLMGIDVGVPKSPDTPLEDSEIRILRETLKTMGLVK